MDTENFCTDSSSENVPPVSRAPPSSTHSLGSNTPDHRSASPGTEQGMDYGQNENLSPAENAKSLSPTRPLSVSPLSSPLSQLSRTPSIPDDFKHDIQTSPPAPKQLDYHKIKGNFILNIVHVTPEKASKENVYFQSLQELQEHAEILALTLARGFGIHTGPDTVSDNDFCEIPNPSGWQRRIRNADLPRRFLEANENLVPHMFPATQMETVQYWVFAKGDPDRVLLPFVDHFIYKLTDEMEEGEIEEDSSGRLECWEIWGYL
ncbi:hypothetical protein Dda_0090 [Drechslerella dactyloides]|uniref:Uncharacterized protein n=1 Tax=Drechslerella dactyloides TaxID=74499 RepID=A0AAD6J3Q5_DREDA|nr:hypothetical protein Dda_0090 [Drechslerella dactyloides]